MSQLECEITASREDGALRWRRLGASEPNGWIAAEFVQGDVTIGSIVIIELQNSLGRTNAVSCRLRDVVSEPLPTSDNHEPDTLNPASGQLRWVNILNPIEDEHAEGKIRPAVLVALTGNHWRVMGLTRKSKYQSGEERRAIPNYEAVGLKGPGFIWGHRLTRITSDSVHGFIGYANHQLVEEIVDIARRDMSPNEVDDLRSVTRPSAKSRQTNGQTRNNHVSKQLHLTSDSLINYLENNEQQVRADLSRYYFSDLYTGRYFEFFSRSANPYSFDGNDIAALMCLSISPKANLAADLLTLNKRHDFVIQPNDREIAIWMRPSTDYVEGSWFHNLHDELCKIPNVAGVVASKLMASKFPHAIPVYDNDVSALLNHPQQWWLGWNEAMTSPRLRRLLANLRESMELHQVSLLRVIDVVLWMEAQRRKRDGSL